MAYYVLSRRRLRNSIPPPPSSPLPPPLPPPPPLPMCACARSHHHSERRMPQPRAHVIMWRGSLFVVCGPRITPVSNLSLRLSTCLLVDPLASFDDFNVGVAITVIGAHAQRHILLPLWIHWPLLQAVFDQGPWVRRLVGFWNWEDISTLHGLMDSRRPPQPSTFNPTVIGCLYAAPEPSRQYRCIRMQ